SEGALHGRGGDLRLALGHACVRLPVADAGTAVQGQRQRPGPAGRLGWRPQRPPGRGRAAAHPARDPRRELIGAAGPQANTRAKARAGTRAALSGPSVMGTVYRPGDFPERGAPPATGLALGDAWFWHGDQTLLQALVEHPRVKPAHAAIQL